MKPKLALLLTFAMLAGSASFGAPDDPSYYFGLITSPSGTRYAVQTLTSWPEKQGRFQVFDTASGDLKWEEDCVLGHIGDLYIADDGDLAVMVRWIAPRHGWNPGEGDGHPNWVPSAPEDSVWTQIKKEVAVEFFNRGKRTGFLTIEGLGVQPTDLRPTASRLMYFIPSRRLAEHLVSPVAAVNDNPAIIQDLLVLQTCGGNCVVVDIGTGRVRGVLSVADLPFPDRTLTPVDKSPSMAEMRERLVEILDANARQPE